MGDKLTPEQRHHFMSRIRSKSTKPEVKVRRELFSRGYRFRLNVKKLPGSPDIVLPKYRTAIFVNGCFWHGHKGCKYYVLPKTNVEFWESKILRNRERDTIDYSRLEALHWNVIVIWECELKSSSFEARMDKVIEALHSNKASWESYRKERKEQIEKKRQERRDRKEKDLRQRSEVQILQNVPPRVVKLSLEEEF
ncbi:MAG: very short patch repair endonuclease [Bacteroidales bacterium]|nr:very short patch repair endonuclease [Bacteroidales bacterium]